MLLPFSTSHYLTVILKPHAPPPIHVNRVLWWVSNPTPPSNPSSPSTQKYSYPTGIKRVFLWMPHLFLGTPSPPSTPEHLTSPLFPPSPSLTVTPFMSSVSACDSTTVELRDATPPPLPFHLVQFDWGTLAGLNMWDAEADEDWIFGASFLSSTAYFFVTIYSWLIKFNCT